MQTITSTRRSTVTDYASAERYLDGRGSRAAGNNTTIVRLSADTIGVRLHNTVIVTYRADGAVTLDSGGWRTVTTAARMSQFTRVGVSFRKSGDTVRVNGATVDYFDGMTVTL